MRTLVLVFALIAPPSAFATEGALQHPILRSPDPNGPRPSSTDEMRWLAEARSLELEGRGPEAVKMYVRAARNGSGKAALRLAHIYENGIPGVQRDYAESLKWYRAAQILGEYVPAMR